MSSTNNQLNLIYEEIIFEHNLNVMLEEVNYLTSIITEENFLDTIKQIFNKIGDFFSSSVEIFAKGYDAVKNFCKGIFQLTYIKDLMNKLDLSDSFLSNLVLAVKSSLIVIPVAKIGYNVYTKTCKDIQGNDVAILLNREAYNEKVKKLFSEQSFLEKCWTIFKSGTKNLFLELIASIPLILKCILGYAVATGFEEAMNNPQFITDEQNKTLKAMDEVNDELAGKTFERDENGKIKKNTNFCTQEKTMAIINNKMSNTNGGPGVYNMFARSELMKAWMARQEDGSLENVYGTHYNKTNHGMADTINGTRTKFVSNSDGTDGKYVEEKLSPTEFYSELQKQHLLPGGGLAF